MAKRHRTWNEQKYRRYIKEDRGQGTLSVYKPWILIHDFPSFGMVSRVLGRTTREYPPSAVERGAILFLYP